MSGGGGGHGRHASGGSAAGGSRRVRTASEGDSWTVQTGKGKQSYGGRHSSGAQGQPGGGGGRKRQLSQGQQRGGY